MDKRMVEFIRALRAAGVRISIAESQDALDGVDHVGISNADYFKLALRSALVKERRDQDTFDEFFPLFFTANQPPMQDIMDQLTPEQQQMLEQAMQAMMGDSQALQNLMQQLMGGQPLTPDQLAQLAEMAGLQSGEEMYQRGWFESRMARAAGLGQLERMLDDFFDMLADMGWSDDDIQQLADMLYENMRGMANQMSNYAGLNLAERMAQRDPQPRPDLLDVPFQRLNQHDLDALRDELRRLAARLRSRAAMRQKKAKSGDWDMRRIMRANMRYGGVPLDLRKKQRQRKPSLVLICDLSTSMRPYVSFLLTLVYELQDQVRRTNSFIFIDDMVDVTMAFEEHDSQDAVEIILRENPPGYYSTDLGNSLNTFEQQHMGTIDHRTTVIVLGDGRNNYNNPRLDIAQHIQRKARRVFWFCPEHPMQWGTGDSDMDHYASLSSGVFQVRTLRELANAVDDILADGQS